MDKEVIEKEENNTQAILSKKSELFFSLYYAAEFYKIIQENHRAAYFYWKALKYDETFDILCNAAKVYSLLGKFEIALELYNKAYSQAASKDILYRIYELRFHLSIKLYKRRAYGRSLKLLKTIPPRFNERENHYLKSMLYYNLNKFPKACEHLEKAKAGTKPGDNFLGSTTNLVETS
ncbi:MAG: hypothetical protein ABEH43_03505 [Flavobacteriales bacterium]